MEARLREKLRRKIIQERIRKLEKELKEIENVHKSIVMDYGSELSIRQMETREKKVLSEIKKLKRLLNVPEIKTSDKTLRKAIDVMKNEILVLERRKGEISKQQIKIREYIQKLKTILEL